MTYYRLAGEKTAKPIFCAAILLLLMFSRNSMYTFTIIPFNIVQLSMYGVIGLIGIWFLISNKSRLKEVLLDKRMVFVLLATAVYLIPVLVKRDLQMMNVSVLVCVYAGLFFSFFISVSALAKIFVGIMAALAAYSLLACYLLAPLVERGIFTVPIINYQDWRIFHNFVFAFPRILEGYLRNFGMFREPGVYQFFLNLALFCNHFVVRWSRPWVKWVICALLAVTVVSTFSTAGFVVTALLAVAVFFREKWYRDKRVMILLGVMGLAVVIAAIVTVLRKGILYNALYGMIEKLFVVNTSSAARYEAVFVDLKIFLQHPLFGEKIAKALTSVENNTSSTLLLYASYGILGGTWNVLGWLALAWDKERSIWLNLLLFAALMMSFNTQNLTTDVFFWLMPMMALVEKGVPLLTKKG